MASNRAKQLQNMLSQIPGANQRVQQGLEQARLTQLQSSIGQAPTPQQITQPAQQIGAAQAGQSQQAGLQVAGQAQQTAGQIGQLGLQARQREAGQRSFEQEIGLQGRQRELAERLNNLSNEKKNELLDKQLAFNQDERGRAILNERQLADWATLRARNDEEYQNYAQQVQQLTERKLAVLETAYKKIAQTLNQGYTTRGQRLDQSLKKELAEKKRALEQKLAKERNAAANRSAMWSAGGAIAGAVVGSMVAPGAGTAAGASAGASIGAATGTAVGGAAEK